MSKLEWYVVEKSDDGIIYIPTKVSGNTAEEVREQHRAEKPWKNETKTVYYRVVKHVLTSEVVYGRILI